MRIPEVYRTIDAPAVLSSLPGYKYAPAPPKKPSGARSDYFRICPLSEREHHVEVHGGAVAD